MYSRVGVMAPLRLPVSRGVTCLSSDKEASRRGTTHPAKSDGQEELDGFSGRRHLVTRRWTVATHARRLTVTRLRVDHVTAD